MAWRSYVDPRDGKVYWTDAPEGTTDAGNYSFIPDSQYQSEPGPQTTPTVSKSIDQMRNELRNAGYGGPWDDASVQASYTRTVNGGNARVGGGFDPRLLNDYSRSQGAFNQQDFDEFVRQFNTQMDMEGRRLGLTQQQIDNQKDQFYKRLYADTSMGLLSGAVELAKTPENWLDYANFTNQGKDIFQSLFGDQANAAFGAPSGYSASNSITNVLRQLGITPGTIPGTGENPSGTPSGGGQPGTYNTKNGPKTLQQMETELRAAGWPGGEDVATAYARTTGGSVTPNVTPNPSPATPSTGQQGGDFNILPIPGGQGVEPVGEAQTSSVPLPHQINPAVWDSMSPTAQKMVLASAQRGNTPSGVWTPEDFLGQLNNARPKGVAPRQVNFNWSQPSSYF